MAWSGMDPPFLASMRTSMRWRLGEKSQKTGGSKDWRTKQSEGGLNLRTRDYWVGERRAEGRISGSKEGGVDDPRSERKASRED